MTQFKHLFTLMLVFAFVLNCNSADHIEKEKRISVKKGGGHALGAVITDVKEDSPVKEGALLMDVIDDSEAEKIGLQKDDIFVEFEGEKIKNAKQLHDLAKEIEEEKEVAFKMHRDGKVMDFKATMKPMEDQKFVHVTVGDDDDIDIDIAGEHPMPHSGFAASMMKKFNIHVDNNKGGFLGVMADDLSDSLLEYFEVEYGVLVKELVEDSPAKKAGLKAGDVIYKIEGKEIHDFRDLTRTLNYYDPENEVKIEYSRKGSQKSVKVKLGKKEGKHFGYKFRTDKAGPHDDHLIWIEEEGDKPIKIMKKIRKIGEGDEVDIDMEIYII